MSPEKPEVTGSNWRLSGIWVLFFIIFMRKLLVLFLADQKRENNSSQEQNRKGNPLAP